MAEHHGVFEKLAGRDHRVETRPVDEHVIGAVGLAGAGRARRHRDRARQRRIALDETLGDRRLAGAGGRGQHQQKAAATDRGRGLRRGPAAAHSSRLCVAASRAFKRRVHGTRPGTGMWR
jgi:hypothetical protein